MGIGAFQAYAKRWIAGARRGFALGPPQPSRLVLWVPVALGAGSAVYFALAAEPPTGLGTGCAVAAVAAVLAAGVMRRRAWPVFGLILFAAACAGFAIAQARTHALAPPQIASDDRARGVEGWIERVRRSGGRDRLILRVEALEGAETPPKRVRVRANLGEFRPGDRIGLRAVLSPPPPPAAPGGYDPARAAWFDRIALTGYAITRPEALPETGEDRWARRWVAWRWSLAERIAETAGPRTGGVAAALLTGERAGVAPEDAEALRKSGLGHILAISGLHMALLAGAVYFAALLALASIERFARAHDPRKPAAAIALMAAAGYLALSGAAVSTQRAFIMAAVVLVGVMLERRAFSLRSLAIAAVVVLVIAPESVVEPGFQMSFSAAAALIAVYEIWRDRRRSDRTPPGLVGRVRGAFLGIAATSLIAGAATGVIAAFHFQRVAAYGFLANLAAMPVFTFWVMPSGVAALALAPLGLEAPALTVMDYGLRVVLGVAHRAAETPGAAAAAAAPPGFVLAAYGLGFVVFVIGRGAARPVGAVAAALALGLWTVQPAPNLMVSDDGVVVGRFAGGAGWSATDLRRGRFETGVFLQRAGAGEIRPGRAPVVCDSLGCVGETAEGAVIAVTESHEALAEDCARARIVVFRGEATAWRRRRCAAILLDDAARAELGGSEIWIRDGEVIRLDSALRAQGRRPWAAGADRLWATG
ncbi:hypothetical protein DDZ18_05940 [Marinicauda salina]|uniref:ComEC family competence protein n=1 Tax=Marinicauda salina TaxID=2135793 RepID=A0A2U2BT94_9PROT|nr:ComEC/Rec2 family competence protein [Marinicauda salina]PWE17233.1 hypothetical protein DDZ18_05940 [Marinicauda salina]